MHDGNGISQPLVHEHFKKFMLSIGFALELRSHSPVFEMLLYVLEILVSQTAVVKRRKIHSKSFLFL